MLADARSAYRVHSEFKIPTSELFDRGVFPDQGDGSVIDELDLHQGTEDPGFNRHSLVTQKLEKTIEEWFGRIPREGAIKARSAALADRTREGELRDRKNSATYCVESSIHAPLVIGKNSQGRQPPRRALELLLTVTAFQPHQHRKTDTDTSRQVSADPHLGARNPLDHHLHFFSPPLKLDSNKFSSRPPSNVTRPPYRAPAGTRTVASRSAPSHEV